MDWRDLKKKKKAELLKVHIVLVIWKLTLSLRPSYFITPVLSPLFHTQFEGSYIKWAKLGTVSWNWVSIHKFAGSYSDKGFFDLMKYMSYSSERAPGKAKSRIGYETPVKKTNLVEKTSLVSCFFFFFFLLALCTIFILTFHFIPSFGEN